MYTLFQRKEITLRAALLGAVLLAGSPLSPAIPPARAEAIVRQEQNPIRASFQAIQDRIDAVRPNLTRSTVAIFVGDGTGSGVILTPDGLVLTAGHVISGQQGQRIRVVLEDGRNLAATYLGADRRSDLGLLQIDNAQNLPAATLGDSATLRPGQWVLATGHPLGRRPGRPPVVRLGRVFGSSENAKVGREKKRLATDAALISGDSGGPLFDLNGRVVGIHSMITSAGKAEASLHIPVNLAKMAIAQARKGETPESWDGQPAMFTAALSDGQERFRVGDKAGALRFARKATATDPTSATARLFLARTLARNAQPGPAAIALQEAIEEGFGETKEIREDPDLTPLLRRPALAQLLQRVDALNAVPGLRKNDRFFRAAEATIAGGEPSVVRIQANGKDVALGTVVSSDGDILTKASELPDGELECTLPDGETVAVEQRATDADWDVALLKVSTSKLEPVSFSENTQVGHWTFSPDGTENPAVAGVVGVATMPVRGRGIAPRATSKAYMGALLQPVGPSTLRALGLSQGVRLEVEEDLPAARAGIQSGDIVFEVDGRPVGDPDELMDTLVGKEPGDTIRVRLARGDDRLTATINLAARPAGLPGRGGLPEMLSGAVSRMAGPFPNVMHHDAVLAPNAMGGPLLDLEGHCIGINIARADRTSTYAIRAADLKTIYARLKSQ